MIELSQEQLRKIQLYQLEMLEEVDRICKRCNIHYNIIAGTLLGAVRHGGYIPWDDDADVAFLRSEYEKFRTACKSELDRNKFYFQDQRNTKGYRWGYGKLRRKGTIFLREHQEHMPYAQGVFIDIFPLDAVPENYVNRSIKNLECFIVRKLMWAKAGKIADKNAVKRVIYTVLDRIPEREIFRYYRFMVERAKKTEKSSRWVRILTFPTPNDSWGYLKKWYEKSAPIDFEGKVFSGIAEYEEYLSFKFGDYMTLPPESQRKTHPVSKLKL